MNTGTPVVALDGKTQSLALFSAANVFVDSVLVKTYTACTGATTALITDVGNDTNDDVYVAGATYDIKAAVSATNLLWLTIAANASLTTATTIQSVKLTTTVENVKDIATGCAFDIWVGYKTLPIL